MKTILSQFIDFVNINYELKLKSYEFNKYKTKKKIRIIKLNVFGKKNKLSVYHQLINFLILNLITNQKKFMILTMIL